MFVKIVGIGASAGGLQALESFFSELPSGLGAAFVVIQHLSPDHASSMSAILQRVTSIPVSPLDKDVIPQPNNIYVKLPDYDVEVKNGLRVTKRVVNRQQLQLPIDDFFFSLAESMAEESVAIVFSGMGSDGSRGLKEIKARGGLVMVQDPETAQFDGMPRAALRHIVADVIMSPGKLASRLATILRNDDDILPYKEDFSKLDNSEMLKTLLDRIKLSTRIDFNNYRQATIMRRIEKRMLITQVHDFGEYIRQTLENEEELQVLRQSFLIGVTRFFRDKDAFDILEHEVIPRLITGTPDHRELRVWVPSCSTGEEVYSIAILIQNYISKNAPNKRYKIFGSDLDRKSIILASRGEYDETIVADVPSEYLQTYFTRQSNGFKVRGELKENIMFAVQNLMEDPPFIRIDLLSCRNFLIYVNSEAQQRVLSNFHFAMNPNGFLFLGPSENLGSLQSAFTSIDRRWKIYRKRAGDSVKINKGLSPGIENKKPFPGQFVISPPGYVALGPPKKTKTGGSSAAISQSNMDYFSRYLSERFAPSCLFVNQQYDIIYLNGEFDDLLHLPRFNAHLSLQTVVSEDVQSLLASGVDRVLMTGSSGVFERINIAKPDAAEPKWIKVQFTAHEFIELQEPIAIIEFFPIEDALDSENGEGASEVYSIDRRMREKVRELEIELLRSEQRAQKLYNELEATNEELQSSNRELMASNEEMQSSNEELQSVNEELYTVNNEFQRKNEELNDINNDVSNLLKSTQISTIFVDSQLKIRRFTPGVSQQFDLHNSDIGRPLAVFANPFDELDIEALCVQVLETHQRYDEEVQDRNGNFFLLRMLPYQTDDDRIEGIVITFVDINDLVRTRRRLTDLALKYEAIFNNTQEVIAVVRESGKIEEINQVMLETSPEDMIGEYFTDFIATDQEKVKFSERLRISFDQHEVATFTTMLNKENHEYLYVEIEIIPITKNFDTKGKVNVDQAMLIVHDVTDKETERLGREKIITDYEARLNELKMAAGLIDMSERLMIVNQMGKTYGDGMEEHYMGTSISEFLNEDGLCRYRNALNNMKEGSHSELVVYPPGELTESDVEETYIYRPVYSDGKLIFVYFERPQSEEQ